MLFQQAIASILFLIVIMPMGEDEVPFFYY